MSRRGFLLDPNRCTGCDACSIACAIENHGEQVGAGAPAWRQVVVFNAEHRPGAPTFALSLACHHCAEPACARACPAGALARDATTGAVLLDAARCIGCRYCAWACPYDAPRFDAATGTVGKCSLCEPRLREGRDPACVVACPTGALRLVERTDAAPAPVPGLVASRLGPSFRVAPLRSAAPEVEPEWPPESSAAAPDMAWPEPAGRRLGLEREWPLLAFTSAVGVLAGWFAATRAGMAVAPWTPALFFAVGAAATLASLAHLGRRERAWRAALDWRASWLSREVLLFPAFLGAASAWLLVRTPAGPALAAAGWAIALLGLAAAHAVDRVYAAIVPVTGRPAPGRTPAVGPVLAGGLWLAGVLAGTAALWAPALAWKLWFGLFRLLPASRTPGRRALVVARVLLGLALPAGLLVAGRPAAAALMAVAGEVAERALFYEALEVTTPRAEMAVALARADGPR